MRKHIAKVVVLIIATVLINTANSAFFPTICKLDNSECIKTVAQSFIPTFAAGISEAGVEKCDPWLIESIQLGGPNLNLTLKDVIATGLKDTQIEEMGFDKTQTTICLKIQSTLRLEGFYYMSGKLLFFPIEGTGPAHVLIKKIEVTACAKAETNVGEDGKDYWHFELENYDFTLKDKSDVVFEKLFARDPVLEATTKELVAQSGNAIITELGGPVVKTVVDGIILRVNQLVAKFPLDELRIK